MRHSFQLISRPTFIHYQFIETMTTKARPFREHVAAKPNGSETGERLMAENLLKWIFGLIEPRCP